ncbi:hypothetical protein Nepgr_019277 [Nepenthes gracilis]|uniref:Auxin response factor n=1 Tax=Nepenthes gracilis TaxID=150966 RepID=A0AAD3SWN9_NEPGR|nr:hypothetical protein Nepgr_019277 [Nepenthes gracilis]
MVLDAHVAIKDVMLTPSDANNGGGFSVPRFCADSIFPPLDYAADPPVQQIRIRDVHGESWDFRHIYRGTPRRHLLTTGWSKFVNSKKLIAGDTVVFIRNKTNEEMFVGIRRAVKSNGAEEIARWARHYASLGQGRMKVEETGCGGITGEEGEGTFSRNGNGRVSPESVVEAAELAANGLPFEVVYYPKAGSPDFVVAAVKVERGLSVYWSTGTRVKMAMESEDSSRMTWFQGTVSSVVIPDCGLWCGSPWRMLQVAWDEPEVLQNVKRGARQNPFYVHSLANVISDNTHQMCAADDYFDNNTTQKLDAVSTVLNIGSSQSNTQSPDSPSSVQFFGTDIVGRRGCTSLANEGVTSFRLFGLMFSTRGQQWLKHILCERWNEILLVSQLGSSTGTLVDTS